VPHGWNGDRPYNPNYNNPNYNGSQPGPYYVANYAPGVIGRVQMLSGNDWKDITPGNPVAFASGTAYRTGRNSQMTVLLDNGSTLTLGEVSAVHVIENSINRLDLKAIGRVTLALSNAYGTSHAVQMDFPIGRVVLNPAEANGQPFNIVANQIDARDLRVAVGSGAATVFSFVNATGVVEAGTNQAVSGNYFFLRQNNGRLVKVLISQNTQIARPTYAESRQVLSVEEMGRHLNLGQEVTVYGNATGLSTASRQVASTNMVGLDSGPAVVIAQTIFPPDGLYILGENFIMTGPLETVGTGVTATSGNVVGLSVGRNVASVVPGGDASPTYCEVWLGGGAVVGAGILPWLLGAGLLAGIIAALSGDHDNNGFTGGGGGGPFGPVPTATVTVTPTPPPCASK